MGSRALVDHIRSALLLAIGWSFAVPSGGMASSATDVVRFTGEAAYDMFGASVSTGDVNGDGYSDVFVGADHYALATGRVYIYFGGPATDSIPDVILTGEGKNSNFGYGLACAGDMNGDGFADVVVGAHGYNISQGRAYIFYGGSPMDATPDRILTGPTRDFGVSVAGAGDLNGDALDDVVVGAPRDGPGYAYVYYGGTSSLAPDITLIGEHLGDNYGGAVAAGGDINGDGSNDFIVGAQYNDAGGDNAGRVYMYYGGTTLDSIPDLIFTGPGPDQLYGNRALCSGDLNGDGFYDVATSGYNHLPPPLDTYMARIDVFYGGRSPDAVADVVLTGVSFPEANISVGISANADVSGDGFADLLLGSYGNCSNCPETGTTYVFRGGPGIDETPDQAILGARATCAGDVNGDGLADIVLGAYLNDASGENAGAAYLLFSSVPSGVSLDFDPDKLNLTSSGRWVTAYIEPSAFAAASIDISSIRLASAIPAEPKPAAIGDHDGNGKPDLMVKFNRQAVAALLAPGLNHLTLTGNLVDGSPFAGSGDITALNGTTSLTVRMLSPLGTTPMQFAVSGATEGELRARVYDVHGRLVDHWLQPSRNTARISWSGRVSGAPVASGLYFIRIDSGGRSGVRKVLVAK